eukprot:443314-Pelagomonas_calceolata.AAC.2
MAEGLKFCNFIPDRLLVRVLSPVKVLACWATAACRVGKRLVSGQSMNSIKMNIPVLRRDLSRVKVGRSA